MDEDIELQRLEFLYDEERERVVVNVQEKEKYIDQMGLPLAYFMEVVKEALDDVEVAG